jgi:hypothetical protein
VFLPIDLLLSFLVLVVVEEYLVRTFLRFFNVTQYIILMFLGLKENDMVNQSIKVFISTCGMEFASPSYNLICTPVMDTCVKRVLIVVTGVFPHQSGTFVYLFDMIRTLVRGTEYVNYLFFGIHLSGITILCFLIFFISSSFLFSVSTNSRILLPITFQQDSHS